MAKRPNRIEEAYERELDAEESIQDTELDEEPDFQHEEFTDEDVNEALQRTDATTRATVEASRRRGRAPHTQHGGHESSERAAQRAREPAREQFVWTPSDALQAPPPRPGFEQRWIRIRLGEKDDPQNIARKLSAREGWTPVRLDHVAGDYNVPSFTYGRLGTVIGVSDLILCERRLEIGMARRKYFRDKLARQMASADKRHIKAVEQDDHPIMGGAKEDMAPTVGRGTRRRPAAQED